MSSTRPRHLVAIVVAGVLALVAGGLAAAEFALRAVAQERLDAATEQLDGDGGAFAGATVALADGPLLAQLVTGGLRVEVGIPESALGGLLGERLGDRVDEVWFESGLVLAAVPLTVAGSPVDVEVGFEIAAVDGGIHATPTLLRVGGLQLPAGMLTRLVGPDAADGIQLGPALPGDLRVVDVTVTDDELVAELLLPRG
jgi:hypothetical protein